MNKGLYSSKTDLWETPPEFFRKWDDRFHFDLDVCATPKNAKCKRFFTPEQDGLKQDWGACTCWMNPPYGHGIKHWIRKAYESAKAGATVVCLIPARTDTAWWHDYCMKGEITFIRRRLHFGGSPYDAPFPSVVVVFRPGE